MSYDKHTWTSGETISTAKLNNIENGISGLEAGIPVHPLNGKKIAVIGDSISTISGGNNTYWKVLSVDVGNSISAYVTHWDVWTDASGTSATNKTIGGITLTDDMIGTLQTFTPVSDDVGKVIGVAYNYNSSSTKVWSQTLCELTGATLLANASWSGSTISTGRQSDSVQKLAYAWSDYTIGCCKTRDAEGNDITPDVIFLYKGVNDFSYSASQLVDIDMSSGIADNDDISGATKKNFQMAYCIAVNKLRTAYPKAQVVCCTLNMFKRGTYNKFPTRFGSTTVPMINNAIRDVANYMGCAIVEFDKDGITFQNCYSEGYITDSETIPTHPNTKGHTVMARRAMTDLWKLNDIIVS